MPRQKKPAGSTVDKRNGRQEVIPTQSVERFDAPMGLMPTSYEAWDDFWNDRQSWLLTRSGKPVLVRWIKAYDRYTRYSELADERPLERGSTGQMTASPYFKIADQARSVMEACEKQLGIGGLNAASLGIAAIQEKKSLADLGRVLQEDNDDDEEDDPRLMH